MLILSEFAGAAERMDAALLVNPYDVGGVADAIRRAIEMPKDERIERWQALNAEVCTHNVNAWCREFLEALEASSRGW